MLVGNQNMGGYSEARVPEEIVNYVDRDENFKARYPYQVIGAFGYGWDDLQSQTDEFVTAAKNLSGQSYKVIVSNEMDFARDFETEYGNEIPSVSASFGNEWDLDCATMAEVSARYKRAVEKLRTAECMASMVSLKQTDFMQGRESSRDLAWMNMGLFWEHDWQGASWDGLTQKRIGWTRKITGEIEEYIGSLEESAASSLGGMIKTSGVTERFFVFNSLSWTRTDYADYEYSGTDPVHVLDLESDHEVPSQIVTRDGKRWLRILAGDIPSVGYKVFEIHQGQGQAWSNAANGETGQLENQFLKIRVESRGAIVGLEDKILGNQLAAEINNRFINDLGPGSGSLQVENQGPVSVTLLASCDVPLPHTSRITLYRDSDRIDIQNDITRNFDATQSWAFGFALNNTSVYHEEVGAVLHARLTKDGGHYSPRNARYDWLTLNHFVDLNDGDKFGVTISNADCFFMKLGSSSVNELDTQTPQVSILVGGRDLNDSGDLADQGGDDHFLQRFALRTHAGYDQVAAMKFALEHQNPLFAGQITGGDFYPEDSFSLLSIGDPGVLLWALKPAEDGMQAGLVARVWNLANEHADFSLGLNEGGLAAALALTHLETPIGLMSLDHDRLVDGINQQQIKTYALYSSQLPYSPQTSNLPPIITTHETPPIGTPAIRNTETPSPTPDSIQTPKPEGKGCFLGLLEVSFGIFK